MLKIICISLHILMSGLVINVQIPSQGEAPIERFSADSSHLDSLISRSDYYLKRPKEHHRERVLAFIYLTQAMKLSKTLHTTSRSNKIMEMMGSYYYSIEDTIKGAAYYKLLILGFRQAKDFSGEAGVWERFGDQVLDDEVNISRKIRYYENARKLLIKLKKPKEELAVNLKIAANHLLQNKVSLCEKELSQLLKQSQHVHYKKLHIIYDLFGDVSESKIDLHKELYFRIEAVKSMEATADTLRAFYYYQKLAIIYADLSMYDKSFRWVSRALQNMIFTKKVDDFYGTLSLAIYDLLKEGKPRKALSYLSENSRIVPPRNIAHRIDLWEGYGNCYLALKDYRNAEKYYLLMIAGYKKTRFDMTYYDDHKQMLGDFIHYNETMANFYVLVKKYNKASLYTHSILSLPNKAVRTLTLAKMHQRQFEIDSAAGSYLSAIRHFQISKKLNDSLFNEVKSKQISEVEIRYEMSQKEQTIKLLEKQALLQKKLTWGSIMALVFGAGLGVYVFRNKKKSNRALLNKQVEINKQNDDLQGLLLDKDKLINDKNWLLREVHHRVKNNLQVISSLLNTQSAYLQNSTALKAIKYSQNRIQTISLIHQKLYNNGDLTSIDMYDYIADLVNYLGDCFVTDQKKIQFKLKVSRFNLEQGQALPLGLILNEAITNSITHAFNGNGGKITIELIEDPAGMVILTLADDGKGLPDQFNFTTASTLGMEMIKTLCQQLKGEFVLQQTQTKGTSLKIIFPIENAENNLNI